MITNNGRNTATTTTDHNDAGDITGVRWPTVAVAARTRINAPLNTNTVHVNKDNPGNTNNDINKPCARHPH